MSNRKANNKRPLIDVTDEISTRSRKKAMLQKPPPILKRTHDESILDDDFFIVKRARKFPATPATPTPTTPSTIVAPSSATIPPATSSPTTSRTTSSLPHTLKHRCLQIRDESPLDDDLFIFKRATKSSTQSTSTPTTPATAVISSSANASSAAAAPSTSRATSSQSAGLHRFLDHLHDATPKKLTKFVETTTRFRHELSLRNPSSVATFPAQPHTVKLRLDTKKEATPYVLSKLSGMQQSGKDVTTAVVDHVLLKRHLKAQKKKNDLPLKCKGFVESCQRLGVCTEEQDRILTKCIIAIKWPGVAFDIDEKKAAE